MLFKAAVKTNGSCVISAVAHFSICNVSDLCFYLYVC